VPNIVDAWSNLVYTQALQYWPTNTTGSGKYLQPTTVWSQTHSLRYQFG